MPVLPVVCHLERVTAQQWVALRPLLYQTSDRQAGSKIAMGSPATKQKKPITGQVKTCRLRKSRQTGNQSPRLTPGQIKAQAREERNRNRQTLQQNLLKRSCDYNRVALPILQERDGSLPSRRVAGRAMLLLQAALMHTTTFQVTKARLVEETGLEGKPLEDALAFLKRAGYMAPVAVKKDSRLHGWCYVVDLNGEVVTDGWVLHYSQSEDRDMRQAQVKRREMRRRKAHLPVQAQRRGRRTKAERAARQATQGRQNTESRQVVETAPDSFFAPESQSPPSMGETECDPLASPYNGEPLDKTEVNPLTPLAGGISPHVPSHTLPDYRTLDDQDLDWGNHQDIFQQDQIQEPLARLRRGMSDDEILAWWKTCHLARLLDESLPPGQEFTVGQKRVHTRRMRRDPAYAHVIARHWLVTRQFYKRMPADVVTSNIQRRYSLEDTHEKSIDHHTVDNALRMLNLRTGQDLAKLDPIMVSTDAPGPDYNAIPEYVDDIPRDIERALEELQQFKLPRDCVMAFFRARLWCCAGESGQYGQAMLRQMDLRGLNVPVQPVLRQVAVMYQHGRKLFQQAARVLRDRADRDEILYDVFGHTWFGWYRELTRVCASMRLVARARENQVWKFKEIHNYARF